VEDAAQAHLARYHGDAVGTSARATCYSFYPGKNLGAYGDAGAITTSDPELAAHMRALRDHGRTRGAKYEHELIGTNARAAELQLAVLRVKLPHLAAWTRERRRLALRYEERLVDSTVQATKPWAEHVRHLFVLLHPDRDRIVRELQESGIGAGIHYPVPCHRQPALADRWRASGSLGATDGVTSTCLSLPLYPELGDSGVETVLGALERSLLASAA
jgi:dTDP-4-amino-4,6-dideoxygalactose transaminase